MSLRKPRWWPAIALAIWSTCFVEGKTSPLSVTPSEKWYGDVGNWSAVSIKVGKPEQEVDVMVSTASSEISVVASTACSTDKCAEQRGGTFDMSKSKTWTSEGIYSLGLDTVLGSDVNGTFGSDTLGYGTTGISVKDTVIGAFTNTDFWLGFFGLSVNSGAEDSNTLSSPISQLVETMSQIPSHSYGFTAGASYRNSAGCPNSLTLGGVDTLRYEDHDVTFELSSQQQPSAFINSLYLSLPPGSEVPANWAFEAPRMVEPGQTITALIDSTTPYLWLPEQVCDNFASALNLTYNTTLDLYTFDGNASQHAALQALDFSISFELSAEASAIQMVSIDLPYKAFDQEMATPENKYYFPLKRATNTSQYTLGRTFLQEAYLIVDYERGNFSVHQALFPLDATTNSSGITAITRPSDSSFTGPGDRKGGGGMPKATIAGISVGCAALVALLIIANIYRIRYNRLKRAQNPQVATDKPMSKTGLLLAKLHIGKKHSRNSTGPRKTAVYETEGNATYPVEVGADSSHERFELAAPMEPVELDSETAGTHFSTMGGADTENSHLSEYEREQLRIQYALQRGNLETSFPEKRDLNTHEEGTYESEHSTVSALTGIGTNTSDLSPSSTSHLMGETLSPLSPIRDPPPSYQPQSYQRHAHNIIPDGTEIVYAGPMPNISPGMEVGFLPDRRADFAGLNFRFTEPGNRDTLGSNFTVEEATTIERERERTLERERQRARERDGEREIEAMMSPGALGRSVQGQDLVHVPQVAARRFSWESGA